MQNIYKIERLKLEFAKRTILEIKELAISSRSLNILTGANGSGKSTLLAILAFLQQPTAGNVEFAESATIWNNRCLQKLRRKVTLMHQAPYLFAGTVADNLEFGLTLRGISGKERCKRVTDALEMAGLPNFAERNALELSGGETRRVAIARALALQPEVLLLDEPLANVDIETSKLIEELISGLPAKGCTVIMSTHDDNHAFKFAARGIHLVAGKLSC